MRSILVLGCIFLLSIFVYGFIQGFNLTRHYKYDCRKIILPEDIDMNTALDSVMTNNVHYLRKRARSLGATKQDVDSMTVMELKVYIVQRSVSEEHIVTAELEEEIMGRESINDIVLDVDETVLDTTLPSIDEQLQAMVDDFE